MKHEAAWWGMWVHSVVRRHRLKTLVTQTTAGDFAVQLNCTRCSRRWLTIRSYRR